MLWLKRSMGAGRWFHGANTRLPISLLSERNTPSQCAFDLKGVFGAGPFTCIGYGQATVITLFADRLYTSQAARY